MRRKRTPHVFLTLVIIAIISVFTGIFVSELIEKSEMLRYPKEYSEYVEACSSKYGVAEEIIYSVILTESSFNEGAVSKAGALGLMQITPDTYEWLLQKRKEDIRKDLKDPFVNIDFGTYYLSYLYDKYKNWDTAFAAYNAGPSRVSGWLANEEYAKDGVLVSIPYPETEMYVKKVNNAIVKYRKIYGQN